MARRCLIAAKPVSRIKLVDRQPPSKVRCRLHARGRCAACESPVKVEPVNAEPPRFERVSVGSGDSDAAAGHELGGDDVALNLVGALTHDHQRGVAKVAFDVVFGGVAIAAVDAHRI